MAQTILSNKQSTSGSPYVIYTVNVTPSNRTLSTVDLTVQISAHLKNADSSLGKGSGYGIKGKLTVNGEDKWFDGTTGNGPIIKKTTESWSKTTEHTTTAYTYTVGNVNGLSWDTTSLEAKFYAIRTSGNTSNAGYLATTNCTAITIEKAAAPSTITSIDNGGGTTNFNPKVWFTPKDSSFKFKVAYSFGSWEGYTSDYITPNTTSSTYFNSYTINGSDVAPYMNEAKKAFTATLYTYESNGNPVGNPSSASFDVTLNDSFKPSVSIGNFSEAGGIVPSGWGIYVQGKSKLSFQVSTASSDSGTSIKSYSTTINGTTYTNQANITTDWLSGSGNATLTATDNRQRTNSVPKSYTVVAYGSPDITLSGYRSGSSGTASDDGTYYHYSISGHIQSCKNGNIEKNSISEIKIGYRVAGSNSSYSYSTISATMGSTANNRIAFSGSGTVFGGNLSTANNYEIRVYVKDGLSTEGYDTETVTAAFKLVNYKADGTGIAIGKKATTSNLVEVNMNTNVNGVLGANQIDNTKGLYWKEDGYGDKFRIIPNFNGFDDDNSLQIQSAVGGAGTDPTLSSIAAITGKSGNGWIKGRLATDTAFRIPKNGSQGYGITNSDNVSILRNWSNNDVAVDATGNGLFLGYQNTTSIDFLNGKGTWDTSGLKIGNSKHYCSSFDLVIQGGGYVRLCRVASPSIGSLGNLYLKVFTGDGWNGRPSQNAMVMAHIKKSYDGMGSALWYGCTYSVYGYNNDNDRVRIYIRATSIHYLDIYLYSPYWYSSGRFELEGQFDSVSNVNDWRSASIPTDGTEQQSTGGFVQMTKTLYDNSNGTTGNVSLSESSEGFHYLEIFYRYQLNNAFAYHSVKIYSPNGKTAMLIGSYDNGTRLYHEVARYTISRNSLTRSAAARWRFGTGNENNTRTDTTSNDPSLEIVRVIGYR